MASSRETPAAMAIGRGGRNRSQPAPSDGRALGLGFSHPYAVSSQALASALPPQMSKAKDVLRLCVKAPIQLRSMNAKRRWSPCIGSPQASTMWSGSVSLTTWQVSRTNHLSVLAPRRHWKLRELHGAKSGGLLWFEEKPMTKKGFPSR